MELTGHEVLELHEIIRSEVVASRKIQASLALVTDQRLKPFMENSLQIKRDILTSYQNFYSGWTKQQ